MITSYANYLDLTSALNRHANITDKVWETFEPADRAALLNDMRGDLTIQLKQRRATRRFKDTPATAAELVW